MRFGLMLGALHLHANCETKQGIDADVVAAYQWW
jgi:hypothetical protein